MSYFSSEDYIKFEQMMFETALLKAKEQLQNYLETADMQVSADTDIDDLLNSIAEEYVDRINDDYYISSIFEDIISDHEYEFEDIPTDDEDDEEEFDGDEE